VTLALPVLRVYVLITLRIGKRLSQPGLFGLGALNVLDLVSFVDSPDLLLGRLTTVDVLVDHVVPDELGHGGRHILEGLQLVDGVQRVARLSSCRELDALGLRFGDVCIRKVRFWLVKAEVKLTGSTSSDVRYILEVWLVHFRFGPNSGFRTYRFKII
jgi:hypothetical protein